MAKMTMKQKIEAISDKKREQLIQAALDRESIISMSNRLNVDYAAVQTLLWQSGTLPWQGAKAVITRRLRSLRSATRRSERDQLVDDVVEQVNYLYFAARELQIRWDKVKSLEPSSSKN